MLTPDVTVYEQSYALGLFYKLGLYFPAWWQLSCALIWSVGKAPQGLSSSREGGDVITSDGIFTKPEPQSVLLLKWAQGDEFSARVEGVDLIKVSS